MNRTIVIILFMLATTIVGAQTPDPLRQEGESTIIAFRLAGSLKYVSVCQSQSLKNSYVIYRFGLPSRIEFEYPTDRAASWQAFEYSFYLRGGGAANAGLDVNYLSFSNGDWKYVIYQEYSAEIGKTAVGIRLIHDNYNKECDIPGAPDSLLISDSTSNTTNKDFGEKTASRRSVG